MAAPPEQGRSSIVSLGGFDTSTKARGDAAEAVAIRLTDGQQKHERQRHRAHHVRDEQVLGADPAAGVGGDDRLADQQPEQSGLRQQHP